MAFPQIIALTNLLYTSFSIFPIKKLLTADSRRLTRTFFSRDTAGEKPSMAFQANSVIGKTNHTGPLVKLFLYRKAIAIFMIDAVRYLMLENRHMPKGEKPPSFLFLNLINFLEQSL